MKNPMVRTHTFSMLTSRLAAIVMFAALLVAAPFHAALAADAPDPDLASFAVLGGSAVTLTRSAVTGDVGAGIAGGVVTQTASTISGTVHQGDLAAIDAYAAFLGEYTALGNKACDKTIDGNLAGLVLTPGVYCIEAASTTTGGVLTLVGSSTDTWIFKIGTLGTGALTGTGFNVVFKDGVGNPCNVYWWVKAAATLTDSNFLGTILAGAAISVTRGTLNGDALAQAAVTMTDTAVAVCDSTVPSWPPEPPIPVPDVCKDYSNYWNYYWNEYWSDYWKDNCYCEPCKDCCKHHCKDCCKHHGKDCWKNCDNCKGKVTQLTLQYQGTKGATIRVEMKGKDGGIIFNANVGSGGVFTINGQDKNGTLGTEITLYVNGVQNTKIHTSCSQPIYPGLVRGAFEVIAGSSKYGGPLATTGNDCCKCEGKDKGKDKDKGGKK